MLWKEPALGSSPCTVSDIFTSPVNLTVNGQAHLGHAGGPYLRIDVLARHLKRLGHNVTSVLTTDQFENHIEAQALKAGRERAEYASDHDELIREGLASLVIKYDIFPNTGKSGISDAFSKASNALTEALDKTASYDIKEELLPVDDFHPTNALNEDRFCVGGWFGASCPSCESPAGSYFCERCGAHFFPSEALTPYSRRGTLTEWIASRSSFLKNYLDEKLHRLWGEMEINPDYRNISKIYLAQKGSKLRLTVPSTYGVVWNNELFLDRQALFSYASLLYVHSFFCGVQQVKKKHGENAISISKRQQIGPLICADPTIISQRACRMDGFWCVDNNRRYRQILTNRSRVSAVITRRRCSGC